MKLLVTGADGFIGSHVVELLVESGYDVKAMVYYNSFGSWGWLDSVDRNIIRNIEIISGDIRDEGFVRNATQDTATILHLAALIAIPYSYLAPASYIDTNVNGTLNILQAALARNQRVLVTSTSEVYGTANYVPIDELHHLQAQSPYSASKIAADRLAESFFRSYGLPVTTVRPFNTYGPRQSARAVIPTIITQLLAGAEEIHLGLLSPTRDFNYVKDTATGFIKLLECGASIGEEVNIASQREISIGQVAQEIINKINPAARVISDDARLRPERSEVERLLGSNAKLFSLTGWKPTYDLSSGLDETIEWFRANLNNYKHNLYNI